MNMLCKVHALVVIGIYHALNSHRHHCILCAVSLRFDKSLTSGGSNPGEVALMLQLVLLARQVATVLATLEALLRSTITTCVPRLTALAAAGPKPGSPPDLLSLRLLAFPEKLPPLQKLNSRCVSDPRFVALAAATAAGEGLVIAISQGVYESLLKPVALALEGLPGLAEWPAAGLGGGPGAVAGAHVPSFSAYPLASVTAVGEYLMALPQQLEALMDEEGSAGDGEGELATEWLDKVRGSRGVRVGWENL